MNVPSANPCPCVDCAGADCTCGCNGDAARSTAPVASAPCACGSDCRCDAAASDCRCRAD